MQRRIILRDADVLWGSRAVAGSFARIPPTEFAGRIFGETPVNTVFLGGGREVLVSTLPIRPGCTTVEVQMPKDDDKRPPSVQEQ